MVLFLFPINLNGSIILPGVVIANGQNPTILINRIFFVYLEDVSHFYLILFQH